MRQNFLVVKVTLIKQQHNRFYSDFSCETNLIKRLKKINMDRGFSQTGSYGVTRERAILREMAARKRRQSVYTMTEVQPLVPKEWEQFCMENKRPLLIELELEKRNREPGQSIEERQLKKQTESMRHTPKPNSLCTRPRIVTKKVPVFIRPKIAKIVETESCNACIRKKTAPMNLAKVFRKRQ